MLPTADGNRNAMSVVLRPYFFFFRTTAPLQYEADVLNAVFGNRSELSLAGIAAQDSLLALIALPGYFVAVALVGKLGPRLVQVRSRRRQRSWSRNNLNGPRNRGFISPVRTG